jgi:hemin uptake protein HemP
LPTDSIPLTAFPKLITSDELFGEERQVLIDHAGAVYRLQITKQGKLILTK